jgi:FixJ family two-component response regulator
MTAVVHLIDDDDDFRRSLSRLLGITGYRVASYESAAEFLHQYDRSQRGCILLDVAMEEPDGLMFQERLKQLNITMPVIFVSGTSDIRTSVRAMRAGAEDFLQKTCQSIRSRSRDRSRASAEQGIARASHETG